MITQKSPIFIEKTKYLQGLRLIFILAIASLHSGYPILGMGADLCSFFFVVSGFLYKIENNNNPKFYILKKTKSVFCVYWFCLALYLVINIFLGNTVLRINLLPHLLLLQSIIPYASLDFYFDYVGPSWFLSSLLFCYFLSPTISKFERKIGYKLGVILAIFVLLFIYSINFGELNVWLVYISPIFRIWEYFLGLCLRDIVGVCKQHKSCVIIDIIVISIYICILHYRLLGNLSSIIHFLFILYTFIFRSDYVNMLLGNKVVVELSKYIIFVFLVHLIIYIPLTSQYIPNKYLAMTISVFISFFVGYVFLVIKKHLFYKV